MVVKQVSTTHKMLLTNIFITINNCELKILSVVKDIIFIIHNIPFYNL